MPYVSELTEFLRDLKAKNPNLEELQRKNRATWWDRPQDLETLGEFERAEVQQPSYVYFPLPKKAPEDPDSVAQVSAPARSP